MDTIAPPTVSEAQEMPQEMPTDLIFTRASDVVDGEAAGDLAHPQLADFGVGQETPQQAIRRVIDQDPSLTQAQVAREAGVHESAVSSWLKGTYRGDNAALTRKLLAWYRARDERKRAASHMPVAPGFFHGPSAKTIWGALQYAQTAGAMAMCVTAPGIGKTSTARAYQAASPSVWIATMSPARSGVVPALQRVCRAIGLKPLGGASALEDAIVDKMAETRGLLIIDEAQHLAIPAIDTIRSIHDAVRVGTALLGNERLADLIRGVRRAESTAQLTSRVGYRRIIAKPKAGDVTAQLDAWQITGRAERTYLESIAAHPGALRNVTMVLQLASVLAGLEPITRAHLESAWRELGAAPAPV